MRAKDAFLLTPHRSLRSCRCMIPAAEVKGAVDGEEAHLIGNGVAGSSVRPPATLTRLLRGAIHADHNVAERRAPSSMRYANGTTARGSDPADAWSCRIFRRIKEWKAQYIRWAARPHMCCVELCDRRVIHKGECRFAARWRARRTQRTRNECGELR
jgi:uncharacterized protein (DUF2342 family)